MGGREGERAGTASKTGLLARFQTDTRESQVRVSQFEEFVRVWRGDVVESRHFGAAAVANADGEVIAGWGDPDLVTYPRSSMKPFQALALIETGAADAYHLTPKHLALACASHRGEAHHTELAAAWLASIGCDVSDLACGPEYPKHRETEMRLLREGRDVTSLHHNCSGKHTGFLTVCRHCGYTIQDYKSVDHPTQQHYLGALADLGAPADRQLGIDGCTLPTPALSLADTARLGARFAAGKAPAPRARALGRLIDAMGQHPEYVSGTGHAMVATVEATGRRVICKGGAEAFLLTFLPKDGLGVALKIADGNARARVPALIAILLGLGLIDAAEAQAVAQFAAPAVQNSRGENVGRIEASPSLTRPPAASGNTGDGPRHRRSQHRRIANRLRGSKTWPGVTRRARAGAVKPLQLSQRRRSGRYP